MKKNKSRYLIYQNISGLITIVCIIFYFKEWSNYVLALMIFSAYLTIHYLIKINDMNVKEMKDKDNDELKKLTNFKTSNKFQDEFGLLIAIDEINMKIAIKTEKMELTVYNFSDILQCEIIEDDNTTFKKSTSRTVGRALLGGALFGGAGAIVGGLSAKQSKHKECKKIQLKLTIKDTKNPNIFLTFFDKTDQLFGGEKGVKESDEFWGKMLKNSREAANKWKDIFTVIIDKIDFESKSSSQKKENNLNFSVSDELLKLNKLKEDGILTDEEFNEQKKKLLKQ